MLENKLIGAVKNGILAIGVAAALAGCGDECNNPATREYVPTQAGMVVGASYRNGDRNSTIVGETGDYALLAECRSGCTYEADTGCCWCPDD